jgi:hypothetical protein
MGRFRRFWYLNRHEKLLFFEASILLLLSSVSVRTIAFRHIERYLQARWNDHSLDTFVRSDKIKNDIKLVDRSVSRAANVVPWDSLCLSRSIAKLIMLRRRGVPAVLFAGVKSQDDSLLYAHAWVRAGAGLMDSDPIDNAEFTVLLRIGEERLSGLSRNSV